MRVRVDAALTIDVAEASPKMVERIGRALSLPNPAYNARLRLGLSPGTEPPVLCFAREQDGLLRLPRGAIHLLRQQAALEGLPVVCDDARVLPDESLHGMREIALRDYQRKAVDKLVRATQGYLVMPCGSGKTSCALGAISRLHTPTLILVHTLDLADQWMQELRDKLGIESGLIGDGRQSIRPVTVTVVQALVHWDHARLDALLAKFGLLVVDEAQHVPSTIFHRVVDRCPAKYRLGLTATPEREDGLTPLLELFLGAPLITVSHDQLVAMGVLTLPEVRTIDTEFTYPYRSAEDYSPMLAALAADQARNQLIVSTVVQEARVGNLCLVLTGRIDHCDRIASGILDHCVGVAVLSSEVKRERRKTLLDEARAGKLAVLVATTLADEGLDLPNLSRVFLAFPSRARGRTTQRLGRLMRPHPAKPDAVLFDFVDRKVPILRSHYLGRQELYTDILGVQAAGPTRTPTYQDRCGQVQS